MNDLQAWANRWQIPQDALNDLRHTLGAVDQPEHVHGTSEAVIQQRVRLSASETGARLWRNNNGVAQNPTGQPVRYGLANESTKINRVLKSSDLIGITPVIITPEHVGHTVGVFTAIEVKKSGWCFRGASRETAQLKFILLVLSMGGIGKFNSTGIL